LVVVGLDVVRSADVVSTPIRAVIITDVWLPDDVTAVPPVTGDFVGEVCGVVCGVVCVIMLVGAVVECVSVMVLNAALGVGVGVVFVVGAVVL
jgi:hypothetical protein